MTAVGLDWSSMTRGTILCPLMPPSAFCREMRARKPSGASLNSGPASPVSEVMRAIVSGLFVDDADAVPPESAANDAATTPAEIVVMATLRSL